MQSQCRREVLWLCRSIQVKNTKWPLLLSVKPRSARPLVVVFFSCRLCRQVSGWRRGWRCLHQTHNRRRKQRRWVADLFPSQPSLLQNFHISSLSLLLCEGIGPDWAHGVNPDDYMLLCPNKNPVPVDQFAECHLAQVPAHAVVTRPEFHERVVTVLQSQEVSKDLFSRNFFFFFFKISLFFPRTLANTLAPCLIHLIIEGERRGIKVVSSHATL